MRGIRMPVGSGYFVQCLLWGVLTGIGLIILGTVLVASGGVGVFGGVALIALGFAVAVLGGWASGVFLESTTMRLSGRAFRIKVWSIPVSAISDVSAEPTKKGPALLRFVGPGMWRVRISAEGESARFLPAELGSQLVGRSAEEALSELRRQLELLQRADQETTRFDD